MLDAVFFVRRLPAPSSAICIYIFLHQIAYLNQGWVRLLLAANDSHVYECTLEENTSRRQATVGTPAPLTRCACPDG